MTETIVKCFKCEGNINLDDDQCVVLFYRPILMSKIKKICYCENCIKIMDEKFPIPFPLKCHHCKIEITNVLKVSEINIYKSKFVYFNCSSECEKQYLRGFCERTNGDVVEDV